MISKKPSKKDLEEMYCSSGMSQQEIGDVIGVSGSTVKNWMKKYRIESRTKSKALLVSSLKPPKEDLEKMYRGDGTSTQKIGELCGVSQSTVQSWIRYYEIKTRTISEAHLIKTSSTKPSKEELEEMYWDDDMSTHEIGKLCGVYNSTVQNWMRKYGIETRALSEAQINGDFTGEKSHNWKNGISSEPYCFKFNNTFKEAVRKRDDYTCQLCGFEQNGKKLDVHHVHYDKENCYPDVVALCHSCHSKVNGNRDYWENYFENELIARGLYCWSMSNA